MANKHTIKLSSIVNFFKDERILISRGESAIESGHVTNMIVDDSLKTLKAKVWASMKDRQYNVHINFNSEWIIEEASCSCPRGQYLCHHMVAVALFGHYNVSITDKAGSSSKQKPVEKEVKTIDDLYPRKQYRATNRDLTEAEIEDFRKKLQGLNRAVGFTWLLSKEEPAPETTFVEEQEFGSSPSSLTKK